MQLLAAKSRQKNLDAYFMVCGGTPTGAVQLTANVTFSLAWNTSPSRTFGDPGDTRNDTHVSE